MNDDIIVTYIYFIAIRKETNFIYYFDVNLFQRKQQFYACHIAFYQNLILLKQTELTN